jgi:hypothetical protein
VEVVKMIKVPKGLIEETKAIMRLYFFLRHEIGLKEADKLSARELKELLKCISLSKRPFGDRI